MAETGTASAQHESNALPRTEEQEKAGTSPHTSALHRALSSLAGQTDYDSDEGEFNLEKTLVHKKRRAQRSGVTTNRRLDVAWKNLCVRGVGKDAVYAETMGR